MKLEHEKQFMWIGLIFALCVVSARVAFNLTFLSNTEAALMLGDLAGKGVVGRIMPPKAGCIRFADKIDAKAFEVFLGKTRDEEARQQVIDLLGWRHRADMLSYLKSISDQPTYVSKRVILSIVAIEKKIPFPHRDFSDEYYRDYANNVARLAKESGIPLKAAAEEVAESLCVTSRAN